MKTKLRVNKKKIRGKEQEAKGEKDFAIVAIGASVGGLEAVSLLLRNLPPDTGMAFIYVQHLSPNHKSFLPSILAKLTRMEVQEIENMELMEPNHVYVIPYNKEIRVTDGHIQLLPRRKKATSITIDILFSSLAVTHTNMVMGVVLSGNASDGTIGLKAIKDNGGVTFAQDNSAQASSMPQSAIAAGVVDYVLSPKEIATELVKLSKKEHVGSSDKHLHMHEDDHPDLSTIFDILHHKKGVDFSRYKSNTIVRRLNNRMVIHHIKTVAKYTELLRTDEQETELLYKDLLIHVTRFFRDTETFLYLKKTFLPKLLKETPAKTSLRIWVPACSSGEEAYSIAMLLTEVQDRKIRKIPFQIFATDLSEESIHDARTGKYSDSDVEAVGKIRLKRFFIKTGNHYTVSKALRDTCVFAPHNILRDPPFSKIDFISCRNLLIYFDATAQKKVLATLHFALREGCYLMLGKSETTGLSSPLFLQVNGKFKIYARKKHAGMRAIPELSPRFPNSVLNDKKISAPSKTVRINVTGIDQAIDSVLLSHYMPACAVINQDMEILQFRGSTTFFLRHSSGRASLNILKMIRPEFAFELRHAIHDVLKTKQSVRKAGLELKTGRELRTICLEVSQLKIEWEETLLLIVFTVQDKVEKIATTGKSKARQDTDLKYRTIKNLTTELATLKGELHTLIESQETAYEELQAANEEVVSTNEEYQTLNEELETSKEETEATNEELLSANHELKVHNDLLAESYEYSQTIIATIHEPMLVLDKRLHVKFASKSFYRKFQVTKEETEGRLLFEIGNKQWNIPRLRELLKSSIVNNTSFENFEVKCEFPKLGDRVVLLNASRIIQKTHSEKLILLALDDITERTLYHLKIKDALEKDILEHEANQMELEHAVKQRTQQLDEKNHQLEEANKDLTAFAYISSHDLQEPLRKIQNFVNRMLDEEMASLSDNGKRYLTRTYETATRMRLLIDDLLTYSQTKNSERKFEQINLRTIVAEIKQELKELLQEKEATIDASHLGNAFIIPFQFHQLMSNLITNSLKFSKEEVPPHVVIRSTIVKGSKLISERTDPAAHYCHITYSDNGIGFNPKYNDRIFEVFQRLHGPDHYKGTGMGLAICKRIVENHKGIIKASGEEGAGARFDIYLPVALPEAGLEADVKLSD